MFCILMDQKVINRDEHDNPVTEYEGPEFYERCDTNQDAAEDAASYLNHDVRGGLEDYSDEPDVIYFVAGPCGKCGQECPGRATLNE